MAAISKILYHSVRLPCNQLKAFKLFTQNKHLEAWLTVKADVEPRIGGKFELFWNPKHPKFDSTIGCKVTAIKPGKFLAFEWKGPKQYDYFMNQVDPLTHVTVFFIPISKSKKPSTEVHLIHTGWRNSKNWEQARMWFQKMWDFCFKGLLNYSAKSK